MYMKHRSFSLATFLINKKKKNPFFKFTIKIKRKKKTRTAAFKTFTTNILYYNLISELSLELCKNLLANNPN